RYNGGIRLRVSTASNGNTPGAGGNGGGDLTVAGPPWTRASSRTLKENYVAGGGGGVLPGPRTRPGTPPGMIGADPTVRHLGPVAEDFYRAFGLGLGETAIGLGDIDGVNLAAAKALEARTTALQAEVAQLRAERKELEARLERLEGRSKAAK